MRNNDLKKDSMFKKVNEVLYGKVIEEPKPRKRFAIDPDDLRYYLILGFGALILLYGLFLVFFNR